LDISNLEMPARQPSLQPDRLLHKRFVERAASLPRPNFRAGPPTPINSILTQSHNGIDSGGSAGGKRRGEQGGQQQSQRHNGE
jgi:hypothetical protein